MAKRKVTPPTQQQLSQDNFIPYSATDGNPNELTSTGRGYRMSFTADNVKPFSIGIKDIDESIMFYFKEVIKPIVKQNDKLIPVPIMYGSPERWKAVQADGFMRDKSGKLMAPIIMFKRNSLTKRRGITNKIDANNPQNFGVFKKTYSKENIYDRFSILNNRVPNETYYAVIAPDYVTLSYSCIVYTYYVEQLNKIVEAVNYASDAYWGDPARFKFLTYVDSINTPTELQSGAERVVRANFDITLQGYIIPDIIQKDLLAIKKFSNKAKLIFDVETVQDLKVFSDIYTGDRLDDDQSIDEGGLINSYSTLRSNAKRNIP